MATERSINQLATEGKPIYTDTEEITLKDVLLKINRCYKYLLSKWVLIFFCGVFGAVLGITYSYLSKPIYVASTTFVLEEGESGSSGQFAGLASMVGVDLGGGGGGGIFHGDNLLELYKSRTMVEKTLLSKIQYQGKIQLLMDLYIQFNELRKEWRKKEELNNISFDIDRSKFSRLQDSVMGKVVEVINKSNLIVEKPDKKLSIVRVQVKSTNEFFSKAFNDQIVKNVNDFYIQTRTKKSLQNLSILQRQTDSVRNVLNGALYQGAVVTDATANLNPTRFVLKAPIQRSQANAEANKVILSELVKNLELAKLSLRKETPLIQVIDYPIFPLEKDKVGRLKGVLVGGFLATFVAISLLCILKILKKLRSEMFN